MPNEKRDEDYRVPIDPEMKQLMNEIAHIIGGQLPDGWGFALFLMQYGPDGTMTYISSAERQDIVDAMREWIALVDKPH
jgi:hypothetical protein